MEIGIFAKTFERGSLEETLDAVVGSGFRHIQFNMQCAGLPSMPDAVDVATVHRIRSACDDRGIVMSALSGTFNMAHPDASARATGLLRLAALASIAGDLGTPMITLCTGSRNPGNMWRSHPDNDTPAAWADCRQALVRAQEIAGEQSVMLGIEPEPGNVVSSAQKAHQMLEEIGGASIGVILDPANIIEGLPPDQIDNAVDEAFDLLGERIVSAHGKDRDAAGKVVPAGRGVVPWRRFCDRLRQTSYEGPIIIHGLKDRDVPPARAFLERVIAGG